MKRLTIGLLLVSGCFLNIVYAEQSSQEDQQSTVLADINLSNATLTPVENSDGSYRISFDFVNQSKYVQSDVKYGIELRTTDTGSSDKVDVFVASDTLSIKPTSSLHTEFEYTLPKSLQNAKYVPWLISRTTGGLLLGLTPVGEVVVDTSNNSGLSIQPDSCRLQIPYDLNDYNLLQGVDVAHDENLYLKCTFNNPTSNLIGFTTHFETYKGTVYGDKITDENSPIGSFEVKPQSIEEVSILVSKPEMSGAFDTMISFWDMSGERQVVPTVVAHYVVHGVSAQVQNIVLDKDSYKKNENIKIQLYWTPSADQFPGTRLGTGTPVLNIDATIDIINAQGQNCIDTVTEPLNQNESSVLINEISKVDCPSPRTIITLSDQDNGTLDSRVIMSPTYSGGDIDLISTSSLLTTKAIIIFTVFLLILIALYNKRHHISRISSFMRDKIGIFIFIFFVFTIFFGSYNSVSAYTYGITTVNINKTVFYPSETIFLTAAVEYPGCHNTINNVTVKATLQGTTYTVASGGWSPSGGTSFPAPSTPGTYTISLQTTQTDGTGNTTVLGNGSITINVIAGPTAVISVSPSTITTGSSATINWSSTNATYCTASNGWSGTKGTSGSQSTGILNTPGTYTYSIVCMGNSTNSGTKSASVTVTPPPGKPTVNLTASPTSVAYDNSSTLSWTSTDATSCTASDGWSGTTGTSGSWGTGNLKINMKYTIVCTGPGGTSDPSTATVDVGPQPPSGVVVQLYAWPPSPIAYNTNTTIYWTTTGATSCSKSGAWTGPIFNVNSGSNTGNLTSTQIFTVTCTNGTNSDTKSITIGVIPRPTISFSSDKLSVPYNTSATLTWDSEYATQCSAWGDWSGAKSPNTTESYAVIKFPISDIGSYANRVQYSSLLDLVTVSTGGVKYDLVTLIRPSNNTISSADPFISDYTRTVVTEAETNSLWVAYYTYQATAPVGYRGKLVKMNTSPISYNWEYSIGGVGAQITDMVYDSYTKSLWITDYSKKLYKVSVTNPNSVVTYALSYTPFRIVYDNNTHSVWLGYADYNGVGKVNVSTGAVTNYAVAGLTGATPTISFDNSSNSVWISSWSTNRVYKVNSTNGSVTANFTLPFTVHEVKYDSYSGLVWVTGDSNISSIQPTTGIVTNYDLSIWPFNVSNAYSMALDSVGSMYITSDWGYPNTGNTVKKITKSNNTTYNTGNLTSDKTYNLSCSGPSGNSETKSITIAVEKQYACTGTLPVNATLCAGDDTGLTGNLVNSLVDSCTVPTKCEYTCSTGYTKIANQCVKGTLVAAPTTLDVGLDTLLQWTMDNTAGLTCSLSGNDGSNWLISGEHGEQITPVGMDTTYKISCNSVDLASQLVNVIGYSCNGSVPIHASLCSSDDSGLSVATIRSLVSSCSLPVKCEYTCDSPYIKVANQCVKGTLNVTPSTVNNGETVSGSWSTDNATGLSCKTNGVGTDWPGLSGSFASPPLVSLALFVLTCEGIQLDAKSVNVNTPTITLTAPFVVESGTVINVQWSGAYPGCTLSRGGAVVSGIDFSTNTSKNFTIDALTRFTLTCGALTKTVTTEIIPRSTET